MNHKKLHDAIIANAQNRLPPSSKMYERHHIIPISLGGTNDRSNLVSLTPREHFLVHKLLVKITEGQDRRKMVNAFSYMAFTRNNRCLARPVSSRDYDLARRWFKEQGYAEERNKKISEAWKRRKAEGFILERSVETKQRHRETLAAKKVAGIGMTEHQRAAIAKGLVGNTNGTHSAKTYMITSPDGGVETVTNLRKWLTSISETTYPVIGRPIQRGKFKGFIFTILPSLS